MDKKYIPSALVLYLNYFIHGIGCSILSQQVVKEMLASQWGLKDVMAVTSIAAALGLGRFIRYFLSRDRILTKHNNRLYRSSSWWYRELILRYSNIPSCN